MLELAGLAAALALGCLAAMTVTAREARQRAREEAQEVREASGLTTASLLYTRGLVQVIAGMRVRAGAPFPLNASQPGPRTRSRGALARLAFLDTVRQRWYHQDGQVLRARIITAGWDLDLPGPTFVYGDVWKWVGPGIRSKVREATGISFDHWSGAPKPVDALEGAVRKIFKSGEGDAPTPRAPAGLTVPPPPPPPPAAMGRQFLERGVEGMEKAATLLHFANSLEYELDAWRIFVLDFAMRTDTVTLRGLCHVLEHLGGCVPMPPEAIDGMAEQPGVRELLLEYVRCALALPRCAETLRALALPGEGDDADVFSYAIDKTGAPFMKRRIHTLTVDLVKPMSCEESGGYVPEALRWVGDWVNVARGNQKLADFRELCGAYACNDLFEEYVASRRDAEAMVGAGDA